MLRNLVKFFDGVFLRGWTENFIQRRRDSSQSAKLEKIFDYRVVSYYNKNQSSALSELCDAYGSDKGSLGDGETSYAWHSHTYTDVYEGLFGHLRDRVKLVFECGLGTNNPGMTSSMGTTGRPGASLRVWRDYFPGAMVYGADIDRQILFNEERIITGFLDQTHPETIREFWAINNVADFDLMVDDGLHTFDAGKNLLLCSIDRLSPQGIYVIEDVVPEDMPAYAEFFAETPFRVEYLSLHRPQTRVRDNQMIVVRHPG